MTIRHHRLVRSLALAFAVTLVGGASAARAQSYISPFVGFDFGGDASCPNISGCEDKTLNLGVSIGRVGKLIGIEEEVAYAKDFFGSAPGLSSSVYTAMSNIMVAPGFGKIHPFALAGIGLMKSHVDLKTLAVVTTNNNSLGWDVGGGVMAFLGGHAGVRADVRYFHAFQDLKVLGFALPNTKLDFGRASVGFLLTF